MRESDGIVTPTGPISSNRLLDQDQIDSWIVTPIGIESSRSRVRGRCICSRAREQLSGWPCDAHATIIKSRPIRSCRFATDKGLKYRRGDDLSPEIRSSPRFFPSSGNVSRTSSRRKRYYNVIICKSVRCSRETEIHSLSLLSDSSSSRSARVRIRVRITINVTTRCVIEFLGIKKSRRGRLSREMFSF